MTAQHAPGPYRITPAFNRRHVFVASEITDEPLAQVYSLKNARQFAAAPLLLAALEFAAARIELANEEGDAILSAWLPDARTAIAQATDAIVNETSLLNASRTARETLKELKQAAAALATCANNAPEEQRPKNGARRSSTGSTPPAPRSTQRSADDHDHTCVPATLA